MRSQLFFVALALTVACGGKPNDKGSSSSGGAALAHARADVEDVVANVNGAPIGANDVRQQASRSPPKDGRDHSAEERKAITAGLVEEEVLFQEALNKGLYHDSKVRKILVNLLLREEVYSQVRNDSLTEEELRAYYDSHKEDFVTPEKVQVRRILFRIRDDRDDAATKAAAQAVHTELKRDPRLFSDLATKHSEGPYKRRGGDLGFVSKEGKPGVDAGVIAKAFELQTDQIAAPFKVGSAYHVLQLVNRRERTERSFEQMKGSVVRMVKQGKHEELKTSYIAATKAKYKINIDDKKLSGLDLSRRPLQRPEAGGVPPRTPQPHGGNDHGHDH